MEVKNLAVDRILEALAPALNTEIERLLQEVRQEARQQQEDVRQQQSKEFETRLAQQALDFQNRLDQQVEESQRRLDAAVRDAGQQMVQETLDRQEQVVAAARDEARKQVTFELQSQFDQKLEKTTDELNSQFATQMKNAEAKWTAERAKAQEELAMWKAFADAQRDFADSRSQTEVLMRFVNLAEPFASSVGVYVAKADGLALWKTRGPAAFPPIVSKETIDPESYFKPILVRDKTIAAVCAPHPYKAEPLDFLVNCLARAIEAFGMKLQTPAPRPPGPASASPGKGAAVAAAATAGNEKLHADARQAARLLVSELKLYSEQDVRDGRANSDLYKRLRKQIDQGREQYRQRVSSEILGARDYFHEEIVRVLADGDPDRLGAGYPGPVNS